MEDFTYDESTHTYTLDGKVIPSVTQIIEEVIPGGWKADDWYLQRGRAVHACASLIASGIPFKHDPRITGQVSALRSFFEIVKPQVVEIEKAMGSAAYVFAGTPDLYGKISGVWSIVDWKGSMDVERVGLQLGGYSILVKENRGLEINIGYGVEIRQDGTFKMSEAINLRKARREFSALRTVYGIRQRMGLIGKA